jgi:uncharacterized protein
MAITHSILRLALPLTLAMGFSAPIVSPAWAAEQRIRTLSVTGKGSTIIPTTLTQVRLAVEVSGKNSSTVQKNAANRAAQVIELLKARRVDKLQTTNVSITPIYSYTNNQQTLTGYTANNSLSFQLPTTQAGPVIDAAIGAGATRVDGISSIADDAAIEKAQTQSIQKAAKDAQRQAQAILNSLGLQQKEIIGIQVNDAAKPTPVYTANDTVNARAAKSAPTEVVGGEQEVQATVTLQISY